MVFTSLSHNDKTAFFSLLDEYFESRPELTAQLQSSGTSHNNDAMRNAFSAASKSFSNTPPANPARRTGSAGGNPPPAARGLVQSMNMGNIDTTSKTSMLVSSLRKTPSQSAAPSPPPAAPAFAPRKNNFAPPPGRTPAPPPPPTRQPEPEAEGEWAEALYDYDSADPQDISIRENQRILVTDRTSDDWWTGTVDGKSGLFPASYVKLL